MLNGQRVPRTLDVPARVPTAGPAVPPAPGRAALAASTTATPPEPPRPPRRRAAAVGALVATLALGVGILAAPQPPHLLPPAPGGDPALVERVTTLAAGLPTHRLVVLLVRADGSQRLAAFGATDHDQFEIGSVTKGLTGLLLADLADGPGGAGLEGRPVGDLLDLGDAPLGRVPLRDLATHRSGLASVPQTPAFLARAGLAALDGDNPYAGLTTSAVLRSAVGVPLGAPPGEYSNLGAAVLGAALAAHGGTDYAELLHRRILGPLGMNATTVGTEESSAPLRAGSAPSGRRAAPWVLDGYAAAGGVRSTAADLGRLCAALLRGDAPGEAALDPREDLDGSTRIGWFWMTTTRDTSTGTHTVTWHNGGTGGYASFVGIDRAAGVGLVVLSDVSAPVDGLAWALLDEEGRP